MTDPITIPFWALLILCALAGPGLADIIRLIRELTK